MLNTLCVAQEHASSILATQGSQKFGHQCNKTTESRWFICGALLVNMIFYTVLTMESYGHSTQCCPQLSASNAELFLLFLLQSCKNTRAITYSQDLQKASSFGLELACSLTPNKKKKLEKFQRQGEEGVFSLSTKK